MAAEEGHVKIVEALIQGGADVNATDSSGCTALHEGASMDYVGVIDLLVEAGADVNSAKEKSEWTPLHCAANGSCVEAIAALVKNGAWVGSMNYECRAPLHLAVVQGHLHATVALLAAGADVNAGDQFRITALHVAAAEGREEIARVLLQAGANVSVTDAAGDTALHDACGMCGDAGTAHVLIEAGATVDAQNRIGQTTLHLCASKNTCSGPKAGLLADGANDEAMAVLLENGADANAPDAYRGFRLHSVIRERSRQDAANAVDLLLRWGADETAVNDEGHTPLEDAEAKFGADNLGRLLDLLTQAPVDRIWRRRGWLLLYRAYPHRMRPIMGTGAVPSDRAKKCRAGSVSTEEAASGASVVRGGAAGGVASGGGGVLGDWSGVATWVVEMELEGVFRNVVKYL